MKRKNNRLKVKSFDGKNQLVSFVNLNDVEVISINNSIFSWKVFYYEK